MADFSKPFHRIAEDLRKEIEVGVVNGVISVKYEGKQMDRHEFADRIKEKVRDAGVLKRREGGEFKEFLLKEIARLIVAIVLKAYHMFFKNDEVPQKKKDK